MDKPPVLSHKQIQKWVETQDPNEIICLSVSEIGRRAQRDADWEYMLKALREEIEKVENPYSEAAKAIIHSSFHEQGFEDCRQKILAMLK